MYTESQLMSWTVHLEFISFCIWRCRNFPVCRIHNFLLSGKLAASSCSLRCSRCCVFLL